MIKRNVFRVFLSLQGCISSLQIKFRDRSAAGEILASMPKKYKGREQSIAIIGIPRGGVVVADVVARKLSADFNIVIPRKLRAPDNSENAIGAIMPDDSVYLDARRLESLKVSNEYTVSNMNSIYAR